MDRQLQFTLCEAFYNKNADKWAPRSECRQHSMTWPNFVTLMREYSTVQWIHKTKERGTNADLLCPGFYDQPDRRKAELVTGMDMLGLDVDHNADKALELIYSQIIEHDYNYLLYSTMNHKADEPRLRLFVPLTATVQQAQLRQAVDSWLDYFGGTSDQSCKDVSRGFYVPGIGNGPCEVFESKTDGHYFNVAVMPVPVQPVITPAVFTQSTKVPEPADDVRLYKAILKHIRAMQPADRYEKFKLIGGCIQHSHFIAEVKQDIYQQYCQQDPDKARQDNIRKLLQRH